MCNDFIQDNYKSSDCSDSEDEEEDDFHKDEVVDVVENNIIIKEEDDTTQEEPLPLAQHPGRSYSLCENKDDPFLFFSLDRVQVIKFTNYEDARMHVIEYKTKLSDDEKLKAASLERKCGRFMELDATYSKDRKIVKKLMSKHHFHQLFHNCSPSKINNGTHSLSSDTNFYPNVAIHFITDTILELHMLLMKEMKYLFFNWTSDVGARNACDVIPIKPEGHLEHVCSTDYIALEWNLHVRRDIRRKTHATNFSNAYQVDSMLEFYQRWN